MTTLGSRSTCTVRNEGSAWQLSAEWQTAVPAELCCVTTIRYWDRNPGNTISTVTDLSPRQAAPLPNKRLKVPFTIIHFLLKFC